MTDEEINRIIKAFPGAVLITDRAGLYKSARQAIDSTIQNCTGYGIQPDPDFKYRPQFGYDAVEFETDRNIFSRGPE